MRALCEAPSDRSKTQEMECLLAEQGQCLPLRGSILQDVVRVSGNKELGGREARLSLGIGSGRVDSSQDKHRDLRLRVVQERQSDKGPKRVSV